MKKPEPNRGSGSPDTEREPGLLALIRSTLGPDALLDPIAQFKDARQMKQYMDGTQTRKEAAIDQRRVTQAIAQLAHAVETLVVRQEGYLRYLVDKGIVSADDYEKYCRRQGGFQGLLTTLNARGRGGPTLGFADKLALALQWNDDANNRDMPVAVEQIVGLKEWLSIPEDCKMSLSQRADAARRLHAAPEDVLSAAEIRQLDAEERQLDLVVEKAEEPS